MAARRSLPDPQYDFIVVGARRRTGMESFWEGSTAVGVMRAARIPVICVPLAPRS